MDFGSTAGAYGDGLGVLSGTEVAHSVVGTLTATGNATVVDSDGALKWRAHNLLTYSEDFSNAAWTKNSGSITANAGVAPNGETTADLFTCASATAFTGIDQYVTAVAAVSHTVKFVVRPNGQDFYQILWNAGLSTQYANFQLSTETVTAGTYAAASVTLLSDGESYLLSLTSPVAASTQRAYCNLIDNGSAARAASFTGDGVKGAYFWGAHFFRSDLVGMQDNPDWQADHGVTGLEQYVPTTSAAVYKRRVDYSDGSGVGKQLVEPAAATNLLLNTNTLSTQNVTVTAVAHTLHFTGTGTVTLSGASTAGPLVGTGTGENNRVSLTFTPSAGTLTCTVTGTVTNAFLEVGSVPSSYIPSGASQAIRAAELSDIPTLATTGFFNTTGISGAHNWLLTYADLGSATQATLVDIRNDANNRITVTLDTAGANTGKLTLTVVSGGVTTTATTTNQLSPGVNVACNFAYFVDPVANLVGIALEGATAETAAFTDALPDFTSADVDYLAQHRSELDRLWGSSLGVAGVDDAVTWARAA